MKSVISLPDAPTLIESTRAIGYSTEAAVADIIDNSIFAGATVIQIKCISSIDPYVSILDDGHGMDSETLFQAMKYGSSDPLSERSNNDLGRYGLGLKTASMSQCRKLTVISKRNNRITSYSWDLDYVRQQKNWSLIEYTEDEVRFLPQFELLEQLDSGTLVIWEKLDRMLAGAANIHKSISEKLSKLRDHLSLTFHKFLSGIDVRNKLHISINNNPISAQDPFLLGKSTIQTEEPVAISYTRAEESYLAEVKITPYVLPHLSKMTQQEIENIGGSEGLIKNQGFYVYRNNRLLISSTWFGLARKTDYSKLSRIQVDTPNCIDSEWSLDIKKSTAIPPEAVLENLKRIVGRVINNSKRVYRFRGKRETNDPLQSVWSQLNTRNGKLFCINREHPLIKVALESSQEESRMFSAMIKVIESELPINQIIVDSSEDTKFALESDEEKRKLLFDSLHQLVNSFGENKERIAFDNFSKQNPYDQFEFDFEKVKEGIYDK